MKKHTLYDDDGNEFDPETVFADYVEDLGGIDMALQLLKLKASMRNIMLNEDSMKMRQRKYRTALYRVADILKDEGNYRNANQIGRAVAKCLKFVIEHKGTIRDDEVVFPEEVQPKQTSKANTKINLGGE